MKNLLKCFAPLFLVLVFLLITSRETYAAEPAGQGKATIWWKMASGASSYNVYFREAGEKMFTHSVPNLPRSSTSYTIMYLKPGVTYYYKVSALDSSGKEYWWSPEMKFWAGSMGYTAPAMTKSMPQATQGAAGTTWATAKWTWQSDASSYNVYYKEAGQKMYTHSVPMVPNNGTSVTINGLKSGVMYYYNVAVVKDGAEIRWLGEKPLTWAWHPQAQVITLNKNFTRTTTPPTIQRPSPVMQKYNNGGY